VFDWRKVAVILCASHALFPSTPTVTPSTPNYKHLNAPPHTFTHTQTLDTARHSSPAPLHFHTHTQTFTHAHVHTYAHTHHTPIHITRQTQDVHTNTKPHEDMCTHAPAHVCTCTRVRTLLSGQLLSKLVESSCDSRTDCSCVCQPANDDAVRKAS
jgi:hypothetical protein